MLPNSHFLFHTEVMETRIPISILFFKDKNQYLFSEIRSVIL